jgi:glutathione S-transferase
LLPSGDPKIEIDALSTMSWFAAGVHPPVTRQRFPMFFSDQPEGFDGIREIARKQLREAFGILEGRLSGREWLYRYWSIVDAYMLWLWFRATGSDMDGSPFPRCADHAQRCEQRPSVARALDREEQEFERLRAEGAIPSWVLAYQAGRAPPPGWMPDR